MSNPTKTHKTPLLIIASCIALTTAFPIVYAEGGAFTQKLAEETKPIDSQADQDLLDIYQLAQRNDPAWASAQKANQAAQEKVVQGRALLLPTLGLNANANTARTDITYTGNNNVFRNDGREQFDTYGYALEARQPLYRPQSRIQYKQSKIQAAFADVQLTAAQQGLMMRVTQAYFELLTAQEKIALIDAQKEATSQQLNQAKKNFEVGVSTITDVNDAKAKLDLLLAQEVAAVNTIDAKRNALETITNTQHQHLAKAKSDVDVEMAVPLTLKEWEALALKNSPEFLAKQQSVIYAKEEVDRNKAGHLPTLDAVGSYSYTDANGGINGFGNKLDNFTLGLQLELPLYQGGSINSKAREAILNYQKSLDDLEEVRRKVILETRQAWLDVRTNGSEINAYEQAVASGKSQIASTKKAFTVGLRNTVDVLNAQEQFYTAKYDLAEARYTYLTNVLKLKTAAGVVTHQDIVVINAQLGQ